MKPAKGYYSIVQYCPDLSRLEAANIGVLLFCPDRHFLKARMERGHGRVQKFFGSDGHDWSRIESFKRAVDERLQVEDAHIKTIDDLRKFIARRANRIQITPPRPMRVTDPEKNLDQLFAELVEAEHHRQHTPSLRHYLSQQFTSAGLTSKLRKDVKVKVPVLDRQIEIPFGFLNGRFNLIQPAGFRAAEPVQVETTACRYAVEGRSLYDHPDPQLGKLQLVVVGMFGPEESATKTRVRRILVDNKVRLFATSELSQLIEEIRETAKDLPTNAASASKGQK